MNKLFKAACLGLSTIIALTGAIKSNAAKEFTGAGASFPAPVYRIWTYTYGQKAGVKINYQSIGSGAGVRQIKAKTVNFGASDKPLTAEELNASGMIQFPMLMGGVVVVVNIPNLKTNKLKLSSKLLANIFLGKIHKWDDYRIKELNPKLTLPALPITVVHRSDGSGTTWIFTNYLSKISKEWANGPGCGKAVTWPAGIGGQKNPGIANSVKKIPGAIGYVEYTYASEAKLPTIMLKNNAGKYVAPTIKTFQAAGANAQWHKAPGFYMVLTDQPGDNSWPITGVTYILIHKNTPADMKNSMLSYFRWCYKDGASFASDLSYVPVPENVVNMVEKTWQNSLNK